MTDTPLADEEVRELLAVFEEAARIGWTNAILAQLCEDGPRLCTALLESRATVSQLEQRVRELEEFAESVTKTMPKDSHIADRARRALTPGPDTGGE